MRGGPRFLASPFAEVQTREDVGKLHRVGVPLPDPEALFAPYISDMVPPNDDA